MKLAPLDPSLRFKIEKLQREKSMEHVRDLALEGLRAGRRPAGGHLALELDAAVAPPGRQQPGRSTSPASSSSGCSRPWSWSRFEPEHRRRPEGSQEAFLLLIVQGVVEATVEAGGRASDRSRSFTSGDILGEAALLERGTWPAGYRVAEPVTALKLTREGLEKCLVGNPDPRGFLEIAARAAQRPRRRGHGAPSADRSLTEFLMAILPIRIYPDPVLRGEVPAR